MEKKQDTMNRFALLGHHMLKELKTVFTDKGALLILVGAMLIYPIVYSFGYLNEVLNDLPVGVVDLDQTVASRKYTSMLDASSELAVTHKPLSLTEGEALFQKEAITGVIVIPKGFQQNVLAGKQASVAVYADGSYFLKYKTQFMAATVVNAYFSGGVAMKRYMAEGKNLQQAQVAIGPIAPQTHILYNPSSGYASFVMPGIIIIILQQTLLVGIGIVGGSFSESKGSPFVLPASQRHKEILPHLLGKVGAYLFVSILNICFAVVLVHHWFGYPDKGSMLDVLMLLLPFLLAVIFSGVGLATLFKHRESAIVFMIFLSPIALFVSGISWPASAIPDWLMALAKLFPGTTVVPAYLRIRTMGVSLHDVKPELLFLYAQAGIYALITTAYYFLRLSKQAKREK